MNISDPLLSIITVCLNDEQLERTCESIVSQSNQNFEWIVIDGGSNQETLAIFEKYRSRIDCFVSEPDNGIYDAMNKGVALARGVWLNFMNAGDCFSSDDVLENTWGALRKYSDMDVLYGDFFRESADGGIVMYAPKKLDNNFFSHSNICQQSAFINSSCFTTHGCFDLRFKILADLMFFASIKKKNGDFVYLDRLISNRNMNGLSSNTLASSVERKNIIRELYSEKEIHDFSVKSNRVNLLAMNLRRNHLLNK